MGVRISQLPESLSVDIDNDILPFVQDGVTKKVKLKLIKQPEFISVYNHVNSTSATHEGYFNSLISTSSYWDSVFTTVQDFSTSHWDNTHYLALSGGTITGSLHIENTLSVISSISTKGNIFANGELEIGNEYSPVIFYVGDNKVGINTETPNETLTVLGNISASGDLFARNFTKATITTFNELTALKKDNLLKTGEQYIISDFMLKWWNQSMINVVPMESKVIEPLMVRALSSNIIAHEAFSLLHPEDIVYYDIDAINSYTWGVYGNLPSSLPIPDFKGWIYRRIDQKRNIDIGWDWRYITNNCVRVDTSSVSLYNSASTYNMYDVVKNTSGRLYYSLKSNNQNVNLTVNTHWKSASPFNESITYFPHDENPNFFFIQKPTEDINDGFIIKLTSLSSTRIQQPTFAFSHSISGLGSYYNNVFNIKILKGHQNVFLGNNIYDITANTLERNIISSNFTNNKIESTFAFNYIGLLFSKNLIYSNFFSNKTTTAFRNNYINSGDFHTNDISSIFEYNNINTRNNFQKNIILNFFQNNNINSTDLFSYNFISDNFSQNDIKTKVTSVDFTSATHVYNDYNTTIFKNISGNIRLSYYNEHDQLSVTDLNA
jgi:hypothetical protein